MIKLKKSLNTLSLIIGILKKSKLLQIGLLTCLTAIFGFSSIWIPNSYNQYNFLALKLGIYLFIGLVVIALILLGMGQFSDNKKILSISEKGYNKTSKFSFNVLIACIIVALGVNSSIYLTPIIKNFIMDNLQLIIFFFIIWVIFYYLNKKGIKLFKNE